MLTVIKQYLIDGYLIYGFQSLRDASNYVSQSPGVVVSVNGETLFSDNDELRRITRDGIGHFDGNGAVLAIKLRRPNVKLRRIPGVELWQDYLRCFGRRVFVIGGREMVNFAVASRIETEFPNIEVIGRRNGYLDLSADFNRIINEMKKGNVDTVLLGMGQPRQELLAEQLFKAHRATYFCIGGALDVFAGVVSRAPLWVRRLGAEWAYRLLKDFSRRSRIFNLFFWTLRLITGRYSLRIIGGKAMYDTFQKKEV